MRSAIICLLFVFAALAIADPDVGCYAFSEKCAASGASCGIVTDTTAGTSVQTGCNSGSYCNGATSGTCTAYIAAGQSCSGGLCTPGLVCGLDGNCDSFSVGAPGTACDGVSKLCQSNAYCNATIINTNGTCVALPSSSGADCSMTGRCTPGLFCDSQKCVTAFSVASGSACVTDLECGVGYLCTSLTCQAGTSSSNNACSGFTDTSCPTGQVCTWNGKCNSTKNYEFSCQGNGGLTSSEKSDWQAFWNCQNSNLVNGACATESSASTCSSCTKQACNVGAIDSFKDKCGNGVCGSGSGAGMVVASFFVVAAALFVSM